MPCYGSKGGGYLMTDQQRRFADEYLIDCNGTRAYKMAYPYVKRDNVAAAAATRLLRNVKVRAYIDEQMEILSVGKIADAREVLEYLTSVVRGESQSEIVVVEGCGDGVSDARHITKAPDEKERLKAAELLGKHFGMFTDNARLTGDMGVQIVDDIPSGTNQAN